MRKYKIKSNNQIFEMSCDRVEIGEEGMLNIIIDGMVQGCFNDWDYFYLEVGMMPVAPNRKTIEDSIIERIVDDLKDLHDAVNAQ